MAAAYDLPTPRSMLATARYARLALTCRACFRDRFADLEALCREGRGDTPLVHLRWRCSKCGSRRVSAVVTGYRPEQTNQE